MNTETALRLEFFFGIFLCVALLEVFAPRRKLTTSKKDRWITNLTIICINPIITYLLLPILPLGMALLSQDNGWGLLNMHALPVWLKVIIAVILLDLVIYVQHVLFHALPVLWRFHKMNHTDLDFDLTTGLRFHPVEILISIVIKLAAVMIIGAPVAAVVIFEILLNGAAMFNHSNMRLPLAFDRLLRFLVVTPDMHRVHHSVVVKETNSNYGFNQPWWDRIFGTYRDQPVSGHDAMVIGLSQHRNPQELRFLDLIILPFK